MDRPTTLDVLRAVLADHPGVDLAVLFGSEARGTSRSDSDVDLLVSGVNRPELRAFETAASRVLGREVDAIVVEDAPPLLRWEVARDGALLVERTPGAWVELKRRAMIDWWDWGPTARTIHRTLWQDAARRGARGQA